MDRKKIDINCDMGESTDLWEYTLDLDIAMLNYISSANIACGAHAGDPMVASAIIEAAIQKNVAIGAHPSYYDRVNFGRTQVNVAPNLLFQQLLFQIGGLKSIIEWHGGILHHVKPHGALYNSAASDSILGGVLIDVMKQLAPNAYLYCLAGSPLVAQAKMAGILVKEEVFSDRTYQNDGTLTPRQQPNALIEDESSMLTQVLTLAEKSSVVSVSGSRIILKADTICIHGDGNHALEYAQLIKKELTLKGISIQWQ